MRAIGCGGCSGQGRHWRWCPRVVGAMASRLGQMSQEAENLGDSIGANNMKAANLAYALAGELREDANKRASEYMEQNGTRH